LDFSAAPISDLPSGFRENGHRTSYHWCIFHRRSPPAKARFARRALRAMGDSNPEDSNPEAQQIRGRGRPTGSSATNMAIREGKQHTLAGLWRAPESTAAVAEQRGVAKEVPKTRSEPVPEIQTTIDPVDDAGQSTLSAFRKASGCCPLCDKPVGARTDRPSACKRRVLDNAISSLGLKLRDLCRFASLGWCGKKNRCRAAFRSRPHRTRATTAIGCAPPAT